MLTRDGRVLLVLGIVVAGVGRIYGIVELVALAAALGLLLVGAALLVHLPRLRLEVGRTVRPRTVSVGTPAAIELVATNRGRRRTPPLRLHDQVRGTRGASLLVAPLGAGRAAEAAYRLPTDRRGPLRIGPLDVVVADPFGLVEARSRAASVDELLVLPVVEPLAPPPQARGEDPLRSVRTARSLAPTGGELHSLRPYVVGDDLRRVHWRSTARHDDLFVRVDEQPWQGRTTVLLDARATTTTPDSLELVISAAASVLSAAAARGDLVRLVRAGRQAVPAPKEIDALLEELAGLEGDPDQPLEPTVRAVSRDHLGGTLVLVSAGTLASEAPLLPRLAARFGTVVSVRFDPSCWGAPASAAPRPEGVSLVVDVTAEVPLAAAWRAVTTAARR